MRCEKIKRDGNQCTLNAVTGRKLCHKHGGKAGRPRTHGLYGLIERPRLRELLDAAAEIEDPLDLLPHVNMLQALTVDFVERYDETTDAMVAWHASYSEGYQASLRAWHEANDGKAPEDRADEPDPVGHGKPRQMLDITAAATLVDKCGAMIERIEKRKERGVVSVEVINDVINAFLTRTAEAIRVTIDDPDTARKLGRAIDGRVEGLLDDIPALASLRQRK